jgi:hypothetical protein
MRRHQMGLVNVPYKIWLDFVCFDLGNERLLFFNVASWLFWQRISSFLARCQLKVIGIFMRYMRAILTKSCKLQFSLARERLSPFWGYINKKTPLLCSSTWKSTEASHFCCVILCWTAVNLSDANFLKGAVWEWRKCGTSIIFPW